MRVSLNIELQVRAGIFPTSPDFPARCTVGVTMCRDLVSKTEMVKVDHNEPDCCC